jgi:hypothetical protein
MADVVLRLSLAIAATLTLVVLNGVFVAAEFAIVRVRRPIGIWRRPPPHSCP